MSKRKRDEGLAQEVLQEKLDFLRTKNIDVTQNTTIQESDSLGSWDTLLDICLKFERAQGINTLPVVPAKEKNDAEIGGEYDYVALQNESIHESCMHTAYIGPVEVSSLPDPEKLQGVVATRDILKGELLCSSVPLIVVPNLAPQDDAANLLFSDLSRAEMTAKLILHADDPQVLLTLKEFEYAGKEETTNLSDLCRDIISKYTWAIDHPSTNPRGKPYRGRFTKVSGHAFTLDGFAGKFNHACVPNATMVSYGAVQFFRANCAIKKGAEICVSYGFDPLDDVHRRRANLEEHAGFLCLCPLCLHQLAMSEANHDVRHEKPSASETASFESILETILKDDSMDNQYLEQSLVNAKISRTEVFKALRTTSLFMDGDLEGHFLSIYEHISTVQLLLRYARILPLSDAASVKLDGKLAGPHATERFILIHCVLLCVMFSTLMVEKPDDVGISFGDLYRPSIAKLARALDQESFIKMREKAKKTRPYMLTSWWKEKSLEYTDCF